MLYVAKDKDIVINNIFESTIYICADKVQIKRVIMNLLSNGIKYAFFAEFIEKNRKIYKKYRCNREKIEYNKMEIT